MKDVKELLLLRERVVWLSIKRKVIIEDVMCYYCFLVVYSVFLLWNYGWTVRFIRWFAYPKISYDLAEGQKCGRPRPLVVWWPAAVVVVVTLDSIGAHGRIKNDDNLLTLLWFYRSLTCLEKERQQKVIELQRFITLPLMKRNEFINNGWSGAELEHLPRQWWLTHGGDYILIILFTILIKFREKKNKSREIKLSFISFQSYSQFGNSSSDPHYNYERVAITSLIYILILIMNLINICVNLSKLHSTDLRDWL